MKRTSAWNTFTLLLAAGVSSHCQEARKELMEDPPLVPEDVTEAEVPPSEKARHVEVELMGRSGSDVSGTALLSQQGETVEVVVNVMGAPPGMHGIHIHQKGDCSAEDATSAGGHFAPNDSEHGLPAEDEHHLGDLGNIEVGENGKAQFRATAEGATLQADDPHSFLGRAIIIHAKKDDGGQPTGNAGARIACGEIPLKPQTKVSRMSAEPKTGEPAG